MCPPRFNKQLSQPSSCKQVSRATSFPCAQAFSGWNSCHLQSAKDAVVPVRGVWSTTRLMPVDDSP